MALTTKRFNTPITFSLSYVGSSSPSSVYSLNSSVTSSYINSVLSSTGSTIYTVPAGRTAKVFFNPVGSISLSRYDYYSVSAYLSNGVFQGLALVSVFLNLGIYFNSYYNDNIYSNSYIFFSGPFETSSIMTLFNGNTTSLVSQLSTSFLKTNSSSGTANHSIDSASIRGPNPFIFLGPGQTIGVSLLASIGQSEYIYANASRASYSAVLSHATTLSTYLGFTVIEELGS